MKTYLGLFAAALGLILLYSGGTGHGGALWTSLFGPGTGSDPNNPSFPANLGPVTADGVPRSAPGSLHPIQNPGGVGVPGNAPPSGIKTYPGGLGGMILGPGGTINPFYSGLPSTGAVIAA